MRKCAFHAGIGHTPLIAAFTGLAAMSLLTDQARSSPIPLGGVNASSYSQNFDSLSKTGATNTWTDDSTIPGWYLSSNNNGTPQTVYKAAPQQSLNTAASLSLGPNTGNPSPSIDDDRALGGRGNDSRYGLLLQNTSGAPVNEIHLSYIVEMWRTGDSNSQDSMTFFYQLLSAPPVSTPTTSGTFTQVPSMTVTFGDPVTGFSPANTNSTVGAVHPYVAANSVTNAITGLSWSAGQYLMLEWVDRNNSTFAAGGANDAAMGIDDVSVSLGTVPEPAGLCLLGMTALLLKRKRSC